MTHVDLQSSYIEPTPVLHCAFQYSADESSDTKIPAWSCTKRRGAGGIRRRLHRSTAEHRGTAYPPGRLPAAVVSRGAREPERRPATDYNDCQR